VTLPATLRAGMSKLGESRFAYMPARMAAKRTSNLFCGDCAARHCVGWFAAEQLRILNAGRMQRRIERLQRLMELIVEQYNGKATLRALQRNNGFDPDETRQLAAQFKGQLVIEKLETGGRPSDIVKLYKSEKLHRQR